MSSKGNEALVAANKALIGKNVVANVIIQFFKYIPYEEGFDIVSVCCADTAGSIPDFIKNREAMKNANGPVNASNFMLTGALPTD